MFGRWSTRRLLLLLFVVGIAHDARAQQTLNLSLGYFTLTPYEARVPGDVLVANRQFLAFDMSDFNRGSIGGEWLVPLGRHVEAGMGVGFSQQTVHSVYADFVDPDGTEVDQELQLRLVPIAFTFRILPFGQSSAVQPYFGAGLGLVRWRYEESGEFIDFGAGRVIFRDTYVADGVEPGPVALGGIRFSSDRVAAGFEVRYQYADAELDDRFAGPRLDLGGWTYNVTVGLRF